MEFAVKLPRVPIVNRHDFLIQQSKGKRVLHVGCVDAGFLEERYDKGQLMHQKMSAVAQELWGADIDAEGIRFMQQKGIPNLFITDGAVIGDVAELHTVQWDVVIASEVVEHMSNPGLFFDSVQKLLSNDTQLIVTVPNAFALRAVFYMLRGVEWVHPDHNYWFSYRTITTLMKKHGYSIDEVAVAAWQEPKSLAEAGSLFQYLRAWFARATAYSFYRITPFWGNGLIVVARRG